MRQDKVVGGETTWLSDVSEDQQGVELLQQQSSGWNPGPYAF